MINKVLKSLKFPDSDELIKDSNNSVKYNPKSNFLSVTSPVNTPKNDVVDMFLKSSK